MYDLEANISIVYRVIIVRFLLEGIIELGLTAMISIIVFLDSFTSPKHEKPTTGSRLLLIADRWTSGEVVSNTLAIMSMIGILASPFYLYNQSKKLFKNKGNEYLEREYGKLFEGLSRESFHQLSYGLVFILRRCLMVGVLTLLPTQRNI